MLAPKPRVTILSPALRKANNGNWRTAYRWSQFLRRRCNVEIASDWPPAGEQRGDTQFLIALHARRSAIALERFAAAHPDRPAVLVLTGTDLYGDIRADASARRSLDLAARLVVLQDEGLHELQPEHRAKCRVIYQSARALAPGTPNRRTFDVIMVGHLRAVKDPLTPMRALHGLPEDSTLRLIHIGEALDEDLLRAARELQAHSWPSLRRYLWLGARPHAETRGRIRRARALVISSTMEGGANVIVEAVSSGVPVIASRISGNVGMLGRDYAGYFPVGDVEALSSLLLRASADQSFLQRLRRQCAQRAPLFAPAREDAEVNALIQPH
jgi:putative glycosyltransferase (TIGR04348 family)